MWRTIPVTSFVIYQHSSDVIEPDMNIISCFKCEEYIAKFNSRKFRQILKGLVWIINLVDKICCCTLLVSFLFLKKNYSGDTIHKLCLPLICKPTVFSKNSAEQET